MKQIAHLAAVVGLIFFAAAALAEPGVFSHKGYEADRAAASDAGRLHIVYLTASWCGPCKKMKRTTWVDESVVSWLEEHAVVTPVDVDEQPKLAQQMRVRAMPTVAVFRGDTEIARNVGYMAPAPFHDWLGRAESGDLKPPASAFTRPAAGDEVDIQAKYEEAQQLMDAGKPAEATKAYTWLWDHMLEYDPAYYGVRLSFMVSSIQQLIAEHEPAQDAFTKIRDREQKELEAGNVTRERLSDWVTLNKIVGDDDATIAWLERNIIERNDPDSVKGLLNLYQDLLVEHKRYDLLSKVIDPVLNAKGQIDFLHMLNSMMADNPDMDDADEAEDSNVFLYEDIGLYYAVALLQNDEPAAREIAELLLNEEDSPLTRKILHDSAVDAGVEPLDLP